MLEPSLCAIRGKISRELRERVFSELSLKDDSEFTFAQWDLAQQVNELVRELRDHVQRCRLRRYLVAQVVVDGDKSFVLRGDFYRRGLPDFRFC